MHVARHGPEPGETELLPAPSGSCAPIRTVRRTRSPMTRPPPEGAATERYSVRLRRLRAETHLSHVEDVMGAIGRPSALRVALARCHDLGRPTLREVFWIFECGASIAIEPLRKKGLRAPPCCNIGGGRRRAATPSIYSPRCSIAWLPFPAAQDADQTRGPMTGSQLQTVVLRRRWRT